MNAERLHAVARTIRNELNSKQVVTSLQNLVNSLQSLSQQSNPNTQQAVASARDNFYASVTDVPSDSFTPAWRQILAEIGVEDLVGRSLKERAQRIIADNLMTPKLAYEELQQILVRLQQVVSSLEQLVNAFQLLKIGAEELAPGEAEIALLIPREAVHDKLGDLIKELGEFEFFLNTLSEVATGHPDDLLVRTISSSKFMVFLLAHAKFAEIVAKCVNFVVEQYKRILEIRKLQGEIERLKVPESIAEGMKSFANDEMEKKIDSFSLEIVNEYITTDGHRKNELRNAVKFSLNGIANRIDKGFNIEVRFEPPKPENVDGEVVRAFETIKAAQINMQYMKLEGSPILALPEKTERVAGAEASSDDTAKPRKAGAKKAETK